MPRKDGQWIWKILKKIQLRSGHDVEKLKSDYGVEKLRSDNWCWEVGVRPCSWGFEIGPCKQTIEFMPLGQRTEFSAIELSFLPLRQRIGFAGPNQRRWIGSSLGANILLGSLQQLQCQWWLFDWWGAKKTRLNTPHLSIRTSLFSLWSRGSGIKWTTDTTWKLLRYSRNRNLIITLISSTPFTVNVYLLSHSKWWHLKQLATEW